MKFKIMDSVYIASDTLNYGLPVGESGHVIVIDRRIDHALSYCVRVPSKRQEWWVPECDLILSKEWMQSTTDQIIHESLMNHALETGNKDLFKALTEKHKK